MLVVVAEMVAAPSADDRDPRLGELRTERIRFILAVEALDQRGGTLAISD